MVISVAWEAYDEQEDKPEMVDYREFSADEAGMRAAIATADAWRAAAAAHGDKTPDISVSIAPGEPCDPAITAAVFAPRHIQRAAACALAAEERVP